MACCARPTLNPGNATMRDSKYPEGWDAERVKDLIDHQESLSDDEQVAEDEAGLSGFEGRVVVTVPEELLIMDEHAVGLAELDGMHARATAAFERRDLAAYRELFAPGLSYRQADGRVIDRAKLMADVDAQFRRINWFRSSFVRERIELADDRATETLAQIGSVGVTAFRVVHRTWDLMRRGRYTWRKQRGRWLIEAVEVLEEQVSPCRLSFGLRSPCDV